MNRRLRYYLEFRNLLYAQTRVGTFVGIVEGILGTKSDKIITLEGSLLPNTRFRTWDLIGYSTNPTYCPARVSYDVKFYPRPRQELASYCPLDTTLLFNYP